MLTIDPRAGSKNLIAPLQKRGLPVLVKQMEFGDLAFVGNGPGGRPVSIAVEHKTLGDLIQCLSDRRFEGHQLPGLKRTYESAWLLVEGRWLVDSKGYMVMLRRGGLQRIKWGRGEGMERTTLYKKLMSIEHCAGIRVKLTESPTETYEWLHALYAWWTGKDFEDHGKEFGWMPPEAWAVEAAENGDLKPWSGARQWARIIPGVGDYSKGAAQLAEGKPENIPLLTEEQWAELKSEKHERRLGPSRARAIREWIKGGRGWRQ